MIWYSKLVFVLFSDWGFSLPALGLDRLKNRQKLTSSSRSSLLSSVFEGCAVCVTESSGNAILNAQLKNTSKGM